MNIETHFIEDVEIAEIISSEWVIASIDEGIDLVGNLYYQGTDKVILHQENIIPVFFDLKNGMAGEVLQKFSTYGVRLAIVGDFSIYPGASLKDFIYESNKGGHIHFLSSVAEAFVKLARK